MKLVNVKEKQFGELGGVSFFGQSPEVRAFATRVEADGGEVEYKCLRPRLAALMFDSTTATYYIPFRDRVIADSGTIEAVGCLVEQLELLDI